MIDSKTFFVLKDDNGFIRAKGLPASMVSNNVWNLAGVASSGFIKHLLKPNKKYSGKEFYSLVYDKWPLGNKHRSSVLKYLQEVLDLKTKGDKLKATTTIKPLVREMLNVMASAEASDKLDTVTLDVPFLIRLLEVSREEIKSDNELHLLVTRLLDQSKEQGVLTMQDYDKIVTALQPETLYGKIRREAMARLQAATACGSEEDRSIIVDSMCVPVSISCRQSGTTLEYQARYLQKFRPQDWLSCERKLQAKFGPRFKSAKSGGFVDQSGRQVQGATIQVTTLKLVASTFVYSTTVPTAESSITLSSKITLVGTAEDVSTHAKAFSFSTPVESSEFNPTALPLDTVEPIPEKKKLWALTYEMSDGRNFSMCLWATEEEAKAHARNLGLDLGNEILDVLEF